MDSISQAMKMVIARGTTEPLSNVVEYSNLRKKDLVTVLVRDGYSHNIILAAAGAKSLSKANHATQQAVENTPAKDGSLLVGTREQLVAAKAAQATSKAGGKSKKH